MGSKTCSSLREVRSGVLASCTERPQGMRAGHGGETGNNAAASCSSSSVSMEKIMPDVDSVEVTVNGLGRTYGLNVVFRDYCRTGRSSSQ